LFIESNQFSIELIAYHRLGGDEFSSRRKELRNRFLLLLLYRNSCLLDCFRLSKRTYICIWKKTYASSRFDWL